MKSGLNFFKIITQREDSCVGALEDENIYYGEETTILKYDLGGGDPSQCYFKTVLSHLVME